MADRHCSIRYRPPAPCGPQRSGSSVEYSPGSVPNVCRSYAADLTPTREKSADARWSARKSGRFSGTGGKPLDGLVVPFDTEGLINDPGRVHTKPQTWRISNRQSLAGARLAAVKIRRDFLGSHVPCLQSLQRSHTHGMGLREAWSPSGSRYTYGTPLAFIVRRKRGVSVASQRHSHKTRTCTQDPVVSTLFAREKARKKPASRACGW